MAENTQTTSTEPLEEITRGILKGDSQRVVKDIPPTEVKKNQKYPNLIPGGNPGGRPKGLMQLAREKTKDGKLLVEFAVRVLQGKVGKKVSTRDKLQAMEWLADRGFGKPVNMNMDVSPDSDFKELARAYAKELVRGGVRTADN